MSSISLDLNYSVSFSVYKPYFLGWCSGIVVQPMPWKASMYITILGLPVLVLQHDERGIAAQAGRSFDRRTTTGKFHVDAFSSCAFFWWIPVASTSSLAVYILNHISCKRAFLTRVITHLHNWSLCYSFMLPVWSMWYLICYLLSLYSMKFWALLCRVYWYDVTTHNMHERDKKVINCIAQGPI